MDLFSSLCLLPTSVVSLVLSSSSLLLQACPFLLYLSALSLLHLWFLSASSLELPSQLLLSSRLLGLPIIAFQAPPFPMPSIPQLLAIFSPRLL